MKDITHLLYTVIRAFTDLDPEEAQKRALSIAQEETPLLRGVELQKRKTGATLDPEVLLDHLGAYFEKQDDIPDREKFIIRGAPQFFEKTGSPVGHEYMTPNQLSRTLARLSRLEPELVYYSANEKSPPYYYQLNIPAIMEHTGHFCPPLRK